MKAIITLVAVLSIASVTFAADAAKKSDKPKADPEATFKKKDANSEKVSPAQVRQACEDLLMLAASTIPHMGPVLWPFLLEMVVPKQLSLPCCCVCSSLISAVQDTRERCRWWLRN